MKKVESLMSKEEYTSKVRSLLEKEVLRSIETSEPLIQKKYKKVLKGWFTPTAITLIILGLALMLGIFLLLFHQGNSIEKTGDPYIDNDIYASILKANEGHEVRGVIEFVFIIIGLIILITGAVMLLYKRRALKKIDIIYRAGMDTQAIYKIAVGAFPNFELIEVKDEISPELYSYNFNIPRDGTVVKISPAFYAIYKGKYHVKFQSARYHWVRVVRSKNGTSTNHHYDNSGYILIEGDKNNSDFLYSMNTNSTSSILDKIDLENKEFLKTTKYRSNNEIKSRMAFTPLAMEEVTKHHRTIGSKFNLIKERWHYAFTLPTDIDRYIIDARRGKTNDKTVENYLQDIVDDFYTFYEIIGIALIPPML